MKNLLFTIFAACAVLSSCTTQNVDDAKLAAYANTALNVAEIAGVVNAKQAAAARNAGKLVLDLKAAPDAQKLALVSNLAVDYAVTEGKITEEQAQALRASGTVPLAPDSGPTNLLLPDIVTAHK